MRRPAPPSALRLINTPQLEALPATLLRAHRAADARKLATASWLLRRKSDGRFLAAVSEGGIDAVLQPLGAIAAEDWRAFPLLLARLGWLLSSRARTSNAASAKPQRLRPTRMRATMRFAELPFEEIREGLRTLGIDDDYGEHHRLQLIAEADTLHLAGRDRYRRPLWLQRDTALAWDRMRDAASGDGIALDAISGYRSHAYQFGIFQRKLARGMSVKEILRVNAAPGYSEHHAGCALDIGTPGEPAAEESFERTPAFAWLQRHAGEFGFTLSYPRNNAHHITYEPWHWCWHPPTQA
jgi:D-alanyl-D-alanine carboxypeptidase